MAFFHPGQFFNLNGPAAFSGQLGQLFDFASAVQTPVSARGFNMAAVPAALFGTNVFVAPPIAVPGTSQMISQFPAQSAFPFAGNQFGAIGTNGMLNPALGGFGFNSFPSAGLGFSGFPGQFAFGGVNGMGGFNGVPLGFGQQQAFNPFMGQQAFNFGGGVPGFGFGNIPGQGFMI